MYPDCFQAVRVQPKVNKLKFQFSSSIGREIRLKRFPIFGENKQANSSPRLTVLRLNLMEFLGDDGKRGVTIEMNYNGATPTVCGDQS